MAQRTLLAVIMLCLILLQPVYASASHISLGALALLGGGALYASSVCLVCYHLLRADPQETEEHDD